MLRLLVLFIPTLLIACSKDKPAPVAPASKAVAAAGVPSAPTNLRIEALTDTSAKVAWDAVEGATDYDLNYKTLSGRWTNWPVRGAQKAYTTIYGLSPDTEYRWAVRAENSDGTSKWVRASKSFTTWATAAVEEQQFNIRITMKNDLYDGLLPLDYRRQIYKAAEAWEKVLVSIGDANHFEMPIEDFPIGFRLPIRNDWMLTVTDPKTYLGSAEIEIAVYVNEYIPTASSDDDFQILAQTAYYPHGTGQSLKYLPIVSLEIAPYTIQEIKAGTLSKERFYAVSLHELGHALGFSGTILELLSHVVSTSSSCRYVGENGVRGLSDLKGQSYNSISMDRKCGHWDAGASQWAGIWDVMFQGYVSVYNKNKFISRATLGVFDDLGFVVDYGAVDDTRIAKKDDARLSRSAGKVTVQPQFYCVTPKRMPASSIEWIEE